MKSQTSVLKACLTLTACVAAVWVLCFWPARILNGNAGVQWMTIAAFCCLIPGWVVVFLGTLDIFPNELAAMLVQMTVRTSVVGAAIVVVKKKHPEFEPDMFLWWLAAFYLVALFAEAALLLAQQKKPQQLDTSLIDTSLKSDSETKPTLTDSEVT